MRLNGRTLTILLGAGVIVLAISQFVSLLDARIETGDAYAPYSTLRADPMGMMAVYNALDSMPQYSTLQYVRPFEELSEGKNTTFVIAGAHLGLDPAPILDALDGFIQSGGRAVITFSPQDDQYRLDGLRDEIRMRDRARHRDLSSKPPEQLVDSDAPPTNAPTDTSKSIAPQEEDTPKADTPPTNEGPPPNDSSLEVSNEAVSHDDDNEPGEEADEEADESMRAMVDTKAEDISERWGFEYGFEMPQGEAVASRYDETLTVEEDLRIRSGLYFSPKNDSWVPIFVRTDAGEDTHERSVVMERPYGKGQIVLCSDSYFLSNEAMRTHRAPQLIQWAMGNNPTLMFSEVHLGNGQRDRLMTLIRRYRLHGVIAGFLLLGGLFVWKNSTTLIPRREHSLARERTLDRSEQSGLDSLLLRFVSPGALLATCLREWSHQFGHTPNAKAVEALYPALREGESTSAVEENIVQLYNHLAHEAQQRTTGSVTGSASGRDPDAGKENVGELQH